MHVTKEDAFGSDELGQRTLDLLSSSLTAQTLKSYSGRLSQFAEFCHDSENISPLQATTATVVRGGGGGGDDNDSEDDDDPLARRRAIATAPLLSRYAEASPGGLLRLLDWFGTVVFAVSGSLTAQACGMDVLGATLVGLITAVGGGTIRDIITGAGAVFWLGEFEYFLLGTGSAAAAYLLSPNIATRWPPEHPLAAAYCTFMKWGDAISVGTFAIIGAHNGLRRCLPLPACLLLGMMTATFGGAVRDIICKRPVRICHANSEMYATMALVAAGTYSIATLACASPGVRIAAGLGASLAGRWYASSRDPSVLAGLLP
eukprot:jgi/Tetstr1/445402/TSEL_033186.t1